MIPLKVFLIAVFTCSSLLYTPEAFRCPFQWFKADAPGKCVQVSKVKRHYEQAREWCKMFEAGETELADLASIHSYHENQLIFALAKDVKAKDLWIGMSSEDAAPLRWADNSFVDFKNFAEEVRPGTRTCISMLGDPSDSENAAKWFGGADCLFEMHFACEMFFNSTEEDVPSTTWEDVTTTEWETSETTAEEPTTSSTSTPTTTTPDPTFPCQADVVFVFDFTDYTDEFQRYQEMRRIENIVYNWSLGGRGVRVGTANYGSVLGFFTAGGIDDEFPFQIAVMEDCETLAGDRYSLSQIFQELSDSDEVGYLANSREGVPFTYVLFSASTDANDIQAADSSVLCGGSNDCKILGVKIDGAADLSSLTVPRGLTVKLDSSTSSTSSLTDFLVKNVCS